MHSYADLKFNKRDWNLAASEVKQLLQSRISDKLYAEIRNVAHLFTLDQPTEAIALI
ncbi:hypothetical protein OAN307_c31060 [Octadecabacter antarcticus 307]|uniref:Uncharacterized protein n=1 Tax=Octadecabacter antarcticus 307 TaxID=391626 RepID=M9R8U8_9RHOB|nr:hypothetical protein OAN307_c31060 [Octadecabacter antarcticus 307]